MLAIILTIISKLSRSAKKLCMSHSRFAISKKPAEHLLINWPDLIREFLIYFFKLLIYFLKKHGIWLGFFGMTLIVTYMVPTRAHKSSFNRFFL